MRVLLVKMSSLGDVIHTLPALTDASRTIPGIRFDWVVEENFAEIPAWHPAVDETYPVALRRWRRDRRGSREERRAFRETLHLHAYDRVIDAQGLIKSAWVARMANGPRWGLDRHSAREPLAALSYHHRVCVPRAQHAVTRTRALFAEALSYAEPASPADYGLVRDRLPSLPVAPGDVLFLHGTTWPSKHWPEAYWCELMALAAAKKCRVLLPWGNDDERARAERIAEAGEGYGFVLPRCGLGEIAVLMASSRVVIGVDTGLAHLSAALGIPSVTVYGSTRADRTGTFGVGQIHLIAQFPCAPCLSRECHYQNSSPVKPACYSTLSPTRIWQEVESLLHPSSTETGYGA